MRIHADPDPKHWFNRIYSTCSMCAGGERHAASADAGAGEEGVRPDRHQRVPPRPERPAPARRRSRTSLRTHVHVTPLPLTPPPPSALCGSNFQPMCRIREF